MNKYKNLIALLVLIGIFDFILTGAIAPVTEWLMRRLNGETFPSQMTFMVALISYVKLVIWVPVSIWIYQDARRVAFAPLLWALLILLAHYQGLIIYFLIQVLMEKQKAELPSPDNLVPDAAISAEPHIS